MTNQEKRWNCMRSCRESLKPFPKHPSAPVKTLHLSILPALRSLGKVIAKDPAAAYTYTMKANTVAVVSDSSAVLGLGNIGRGRYARYRGKKAVLFKEFGGVSAVPICLDTQDTEEIIKAVTWLAPALAASIWKISVHPAALKSKSALKKRLWISLFSTMTAHGTAIVVLAGIINALKVVGKKKGRLPRCCKRRRKCRKLPSPAC